MRQGRTYILFYTPLRNIELPLWVVRCSTPWPHLRCFTCVWGTLSYHCGMSHVTCRCCMYVLHAFGQQSLEIIACDAPASHASCFTCFWATSSCDFGLYDVTRRGRIYCALQTFEQNLSHHFWLSDVTHWGRIYCVLHALGATLSYHLGLSDVRQRGRIYRVLHAFEQHWVTIVGCPT